MWKGQYAHPDGHRVVSIKVLRGGSTSDKRFVEKFTKNLAEQASIWVTFDNKNVMPFYGIALNCGYMPALVLPYYSEGNVVNHLRRNEVDDAGKLKLVLDIARGINYLHGLKPPFIHGDIRGVSGTTYSISSQHLYIRITFYIPQSANCAYFTSPMY